MPLIREIALMSLVATAAQKAETGIVLNTLNASFPPMPETLMR